MARGNTTKAPDGNAASVEPVTEATTDGSTAAADDVLVCPRCGTDAGENPYCASCGLHIAVEPELPTRASWRGAPSAAPPTATIPAAKKTVDQPAAGSNWPKVLFPIVALVAVVALVIGVVSFVANRPNNSQIRHLQNQLSAANQQIVAEEATIKTIKASSQAGVVSSLQGQMQKLLVCIPELQQEINGLNINTSNTGGYLTSAFLQNPTITSSNCSKTLTGQ